MRRCRLFVHTFRTPMLLYGFLRVMLWGGLAALMTCRCLLSCLRITKALRSLMVIPLRVLLKQRIGEFKISTMKNDRNLAR